MWDILFITILSVFAVYGAVSFVIEHFSSSNKTYRSQEPSAMLMLAVKDSENNIEVLVRNIYNSGITRVAGISKGLVVVDCGSIDRTVNILKNLGDEYPDLEIVKSSNIFSDI